MFRTWVLGVMLFGLAALSNAAPAPVNPDVVVKNYQAASRDQASRLNGASMQVEIDGKLPKLQRTGHLSALRSISNLGRITYGAVRFEGDRSIKDQVITRYLTADVQARDRDAGDLAVSPANYNFKYKRFQSVGGRDVYIFQVTPRQKRAGLFRGDLWIDAQTYLPVREAGRFVKNPSLFVRRVDFTEDFQVADGVSLPSHLEAVVDTRIVGKAEMTVNYRNVSFAGDSSRLEDSTAECTLSALQ